MEFRKLMRVSTVLLMLALLVSGCSLLPAKVDETQGWSANKLYSEAMDNLNSGNYETAISYFEKLQARYPFGRYAQQAQLEVAYAYYKYDEPDSAIAACDRFIKTNPRHPNVDYCYYLKGLANYNRGDSIVDRLVPRDLSERDPATQRQAFFDFQELVKRFPNSRYAPDAQQRMAYLRNSLAKYEINVADYYMRRKAYVAAVNRAKYVIENYQHTPSVATALHILVLGYGKMDLPKLAADADRVLKLNFPDYPKLPEAKAADRS